MRKAYGVTIDPENAKMLDDAITARQINGITHVEISIADPTRCVSIGDPVDIYAQNLCFTRFYNNHAVPMLPVDMSHEHLSLFSGEERRAITISFSIGDDLEPCDITIEPSLFVSQAQLSYKQVDEMLCDPNDCHPLHPMLNILNVLAHALQRKRNDAGDYMLFDLNDGLALNLKRTMTWVNLSGNRYPSHVIVQELMILANIIFINFLANNISYAPFRNHRKNGSSNDVGAIMQKATYGIEPTGHYGLRLPMYTHGTSPLRRFVDLIVIRLLSAVINSERVPYTQNDLMDILAHVNETNMSLFHTMQTEGLQDL